MSSRRTFLKRILATSAFVLPWIRWPERWGQILSAWPREPKAHLTLPHSQAAVLTLGKDSGISSEIMRVVTTLASPQCEGRRAGTAGEANASGFLLTEMQALGLQPFSGDSYIQAFTVPPMVEVQVGRRLTFQQGEKGLRAPSANLLGFLPGEREDEMVLLSAHYDHLGMFQGKLYPGANDNASGVACVLQVVRQLLKTKVTPKRTLGVAFWSGEEMGFLGSQAFVQNPPFPLAKIKAVLNLDTVGNGLKGDFVLWAKEKNVAVEALQVAAGAMGAAAPIVPGTGHNSDQVSFAQVGIPAATLMARAWLENNHTVKDVPNFVNESQIQLASELVFRAALRLLSRE